MTEAGQPIDRFTGEALALWRSEGSSPAAHAEVQAFIDDANALAQEHRARNWRTDPMITRATVRLPAALVGFRLFDGATGRPIGAQFRTEPEHPRPDGHSVVSVLSGRNVFARILGRNEIPAWREEPLNRLELRAAEFPGILDIAVFGGVAHPASAQA